MKIVIKRVERILILVILILIALNQNIFAVESTTELKSISTSIQPAIIFGVIFWGIIIFLIVKKVKNGKALKNVLKQEKEEYYQKVGEMSKEEQFNELTKVVRTIIHEGYERNQGNLSKRVCAILQIKTCVIKYKSLSAFKKEGLQDIVKTSNPYQLIGFQKIYSDGKVECIATPNMGKMSVENANRLNELNTGDEHTPLYPTTYSELIKNNPNIDIVELIKTLESRC